jgi:amino acid transporter
VPSPPVLRSGAKLGTFAGVFTPSILTILGLILFLRMGFVVGSAGLGRVLLILLVANLITLLTTVSLSAIATNLHVKGGGDYYLISRTLGHEFGGAIGVVLFLAQAVSVAFYTIGFAEALGAMLGIGGGAYLRITAGIATCALFALAWRGADAAARFQTVIMVILAVGLVSFFVGGVRAWDPELLRASWRPSSDLGFWVIFAIFFPAVTGFTQGVSMSGDLADPGKSLPRGTLAAVILSAAIYVAVAFVLAASRTGVDLASDFGAMRKIAAVPILVDAGIIAATLSSALASFLGAPRILQSLARDRIFPFLTPFAEGHGPAENPRRGILLATAIAGLGIAIGELNLIAPIVTMFFLLSYGLLNVATYQEARTKSPSFRPRIKWYRAWVSLAGGAGCLVAIVAIDATAGIAALAVLLVVHQYISRRPGIDRWADSERSHHFQRVRDHLLGMRTTLAHSRDWRPAILAFSDHEDRRVRLLRAATWIEGGSGITSVVKILVGEGAKVRRERDRADKDLRDGLVRAKLDVFGLTLTARELETAFPVLVQSYGIGPVRANTILLNWVRTDHADPDEPGLRRYAGFLREALRLGCNVILLDATAQEFQSLETVPEDERRIDVWWVADDPTSRLCLLLAYLMTRTPTWQRAQIRLMARSDPERAADDEREELTAMLDDIRIEAEVVLVPQPRHGTVRDRSGDAAVVFLPLAFAGGLPASPTGESLDELLPDLPVSFLVLAAETIELDSEPEEGAHGELREILDAAERTEATAKEAEASAVRAREELEKSREKLDEARQKLDANADAGSAETEKKLADLSAIVSSMEKESQSATRRAARTRAKADEARRVADEQSPPRANGD